MVRIMRKSIKKYLISQIFITGIIVFISIHFLDLIVISKPYKNLIVVLIFMLILSGFSMRTFYLIKKDLLIVEDFLNEYSKGNFLHNISKEFSLYEFKKLQDSILSLRTRMQVFLYNTINANVELCELSSKLHNNANYSLDSMKSISNSIENIIFDLNNVVTQAIENANVSQNLTKTNTEVERHCIHAQTQSQETISTIKSDIMNINDVLNNMIDIEVIMSKSSKNVELLKKYLETISQMSESIAEIANQTNLLALNASIEAAKAKNEGKSFTILAEEIKKLATSSAITAKDIDENIINIKKVINEFIDIIELSISKTRQTREDSEKASENLLRINNMIKEIFNLMVNIGDNVTEQVKSSDMMSKSNINLSNKIENTDNITKSIQSKIIKQKDIIVENSEIAQNIMNVSDNFQSFISKLENEIDKELLNICQNIASNFLEEDISSEKLAQISMETGISEFYITDAKGVTIYSNNPLGIGFQFTNNKNTQAYDFYKILLGEEKMVAQKMARRDIDGQIYKFAGVARQDTKGIIQAGLSIDDIMNFSAKL